MYIIYLPKQPRRKGINSNSFHRDIPHLNSDYLHQSTISHHDLFVGGGMVVYPFYHSQVLPPGKLCTTMRYASILMCEQV